MKLINIPLSSLRFDLDFNPSKSLPGILPMICGRDLQVVSGFNKKDHMIDVLTLDQDSVELLKGLWNVEEMPGFERLRFLKVTRAQNDYSLLKWPMEFQVFCDSKQIALKNLKPLGFLTDWMTEISNSFLKLKPSSSQARQIIDLLCDLKFQNTTWESLGPKSDAELWINGLTKLKNPMQSEADKNAQQELMKIAWPRGVAAKWEKRGDQAGILIEAKVFSNQEWLKIRDQLGNLNLSEDTWKI